MDMDEEDFGEALRRPLLHQSGADSPSKRHKINHHEEVGYEKTEIPDEEGEGGPPRDAQSPSPSDYSFCSGITGHHVSPTQLVYPKEGAEAEAGLDAEAAVPTIPAESPPADPPHAAADQDPEEDARAEDISDKVSKKIEDKMETMLSTLIAKLNEKIDLQTEKFEKMEVGTKKGMRHLNSKIDDLNKKNDKANIETKAIATSAQEVAKAALDQLDDIKKLIVDLEKKPPLTFVAAAAGSPAAAAATPAAFSTFSRAAPPPPTFLIPHRAELAGSIPKSSDNDGFTLMAGGFPRNCARDILQDFITKEMIGKHDGLHDGKAIYREGSTALLYFTT